METNRRVSFRLEDRSSIWDDRKIESHLIAAVQETRIPTHQYDLGGIGESIAKLKGKKFWSIMLYSATGVAAFIPFIDIIFRDTPLTTPTITFRVIEGCTAAYSGFRVFFKLAKKTDDFDVIQKEISNEVNTSSFQYLRRVEEAQTPN